MVGKTYTSLPENEKPEIKILCGDQVYLDNPWRETTLTWGKPLAPPGSFRKKLFEKYVENWTQAPSENAGFRQLLRDGANYFCSDDHEFWNNAPNIGGVALAHTLLRIQREWYFREAADLFRAFQSPSPFVEFKVDPLSFCIVDTRINRDIKSRRFMNDDDLEALKQWIKGLKAPGVLVVGQPLMTERTSIRSYIRKLKFGSLILSYFDKALPDYEPYEDLVECINSSRHSVVLLTGDVHFARVASLQSGSGSWTKLVEVVSSPMQVVSNFLGRGTFGKYKPAPPFGGSQLCSTNPFGEEQNTQMNHFATIEFSQAEDATVTMKVKYWPILNNDTIEPVPTEDLIFHLF